MSQDDTKMVAVRMSPDDIKIITDYQALQGYPSLSSALRRIVNEWDSLRRNVTGPVVLTGSEYARMTQLEDA